MAGVQGGTHPLGVREPAAERRGTQIAVRPIRLGGWTEVFNGKALAPPQRHLVSAALGLRGLRQLGAGRAFALLHLASEYFADLR